MRVLLKDGGKVRAYNLIKTDAPNSFKLRQRGGKWAQGHTNYYNLMIGGKTPVYGLVAMSHA